MSGHCCRSALDESHTHESCIWQPWDVTCHFFTRALTQIRRRLLVASPSLLPRLPNLTGMFLQKHLNPLLPNPFRMIKVFQGQPILESLQKICNRHLPVQGSIPLLFQIVLSRDNAPMLLLEKPSHPYFLPLVACTKVGLRNPLAKWLRGEFRLLRAECGLAFSPAQV